MRAKYFIILPDGIGTGKSSKPSDGLRMKFPRYNYDDMVAAQYRLVTEGLGIRHLRLVIGNSMGGMHTWIWGVNYPGFHGCAGAHGLATHRDVEPQLDDAAHADRRHPQRSRLERWRLHHAAARAAGGQRVLRHRHVRRHTRAIRSWRPRASWPTSCSTSGWRRRSRPTPTTSCISGTRRATTTRRPAWSASQAALLAINSADDERNPPETGILERELKRVKNGRLYLIPASEDTRGHGTTGMAKLWKQQVEELLRTAPRRTM